MFDKLSPPQNAHKHISFRVTVIRGHHGRHSGTNRGGLFNFYSSASTRCVIPLAWLSNQGFCATIESVKENCFLNNLIRKPSVVCFIYELCLNATLLKLDMVGEVSKQLVLRSASQQASQRHLSIQTETSYDTSTLKRGKGKPLSLSLLKLLHSALNQICSKPRGSPRETKTKIKELFFSAGAISSPHSVFPPADAAEQGREQKTA